ncbi:MAG: hypothetical protein ACE5OZ_19325 [Candidatus Heimdallarchaeota archaeon]
MNDKSQGEESSETSHSSNIPSHLSDRINQFSHALRLLTREVLRTPRCKILLEGSSFVLLVTGREQYYYNFDKSDVVNSVQHIRRELLSNIPSQSLLGAIFQKSEDSTEDEFPIEFDQSGMEVKSRLPVFNYLTDEEVRKKLETNFKTRAGDARNLFMEIARQQYDLTEIQAFLRLTEEDLLWMVTWGIEEDLLLIEGDDPDQSLNEPSLTDKRQMRTEMP